MVTHPATQALCAAPEAPRPHATAASAVELLLLAFLRSLLMAFLPAAASPQAAAALLRTTSLRRLVATLLRLQARQEDRQARGWIPRCERADEGALQVLIAMLQGPGPRPRALPAAMPPVRPRIARAPPRLLPA